MEGCVIIDYYCCWLFCWLSWLLLLSAVVLVGCWCGWLLLPSQILSLRILFSVLFWCAFAVCFQLLFFLFFHSWIVAIVVCCFRICCICYRCCRFIAVVPSYCSLLSVDVVCWLLFVVTCPPTSRCRSFSSIVCYPLLVLLSFLVVVVVCCHCSLSFLLVVVCCRFAVIPCRRLLLFLLSLFCHCKLSSVMDPCLADSVRNFCLPSLLFLLLALCCWMLLSVVVSLLPLIL